MFLNQQVNGQMKGMSRLLSGLALFPLFLFGEGGPVTGKFDRVGGESVGDSPSQTKEFARASAHAVSAQKESMVRQDVVLRNGWRFLGQAAVGAEWSDFDDSAWAQVSLPHCWNIEAAMAGSPALLNDGAGWYRLRLKPDETWQCKSLFLQFEAAYLIAEVFVNGRLVGTHMGGFAAFCLDITAALKPGQENIVAVKVHGSLKPLEFGLKEGLRLAGMDGDFTRYPGLYRPVHLLVLDPVSLSPLDYGSSGVYLKQKRVSDAECEVELTAKLLNGTQNEKIATVHARVLDQAGKVVTRTQADCPIAAYGKADALQRLVVVKPHLWNGRQDPYLYEVVVEVSVDGRVVDAVRQQMGLRYFEVHPDKGFFLNGKPYVLRGVNRHQERFGKGWAITRQDMEQDLALILDMGATAVRLAHYQHAQDFIELCDRKGLVVWSELCLVSYTAAEEPFFVKNTREQLTEMILQNFNHPSICFWSMWNEVTLHPLKGPGRTPARMAAFLDFMRELPVLSKQLDPTRLTTGASFRDEHMDFAKSTDLIGWNFYPGWYADEPGDWDVMLPKLRKLAPGKPIGVSEYGAGANVRHHETPLRRPRAGGPFHPEAWQAAVHEANVASFQNAPYLWATFVWVMFDFSSLERSEGGRPGINDKGLVTDDRKTCKDAYYFYQAQWATAPMVHINERRFSPRPSGKTEVRVYSNCDTVELLVDDRSCGTSRGRSGVFVWPQVDLRPGKRKVAACGIREGREISEQIVWECSPEAPSHLETARIEPDEK